jgi:hypothetical protein
LKSPRSKRNQISKRIRNPRYDRSGELTCSSVWTETGRRRINGGRIAAPGRRLDDDAWTKAGRWGGDGVFLPGEEGRTVPGRRGSGTTALVAWGGSTAARMEEAERRRVGRMRGVGRESRGTEGERRGGTVRTQEVGSGHPGERARIGLEHPMVLGSQTTERFDPRPKSTRGACPGKSAGSLRDFGFPNEPLYTLDLSAYLNLDKN